MLSIIYYFLIVLFWYLISIVFKKEKIIVFNFPNDEETNFLKISITIFIDMSKKHGYIIVYLFF